MHAGSLVSKLLPRKMAVVRLTVLLGRINDYFLLNPCCDRRCFDRSMQKDAIAPSTSKESTFIATVKEKNVSNMAA